MTVLTVVGALVTVSATVTGLVLSLGRWNRKKGQRVAAEIRNYARVFPESYASATFQPDSPSPSHEDEAAFLALAKKYPWLSSLWPDVVAHTLGEGDADHAAKETARLLSILAGYMEHLGFIHGRRYCKRIARQHGRPSDGRRASS